MIIEVDIYEKIRSLYEEGESQRSIAARLGISRQTVKKYCQGDTHPEVRKAYTRQCNVITDDVTNFILNCFRKDQEENLKKQKHTAKRIYDRLVSEYGFTGSYSAVREVVRHLRSSHRVPAQADIPLEYDMGDAIQIDWAKLLYISTVSEQKSISSAVDYATAAIYSYRHSIHKIWSRFWRPNSVCLTILEAFQED